MPVKRFTNQAIIEKLEQLDGKIDKKEETKIVNLKKKQPNKLLTTAILFFIIISVIMIGIAFIQVLESSPYLKNEKHSEMSCNRTFFSEKLGGYIHIKFETTDLFSANNNITISIYARPLLLTNIDGKDIENEVKWIQITFEGSGKYFPGDFERPRSEDYNFSNFSEFDRYEKDWDEYYEEYDNRLKSNTIQLTRVKNYYTNKTDYFIGKKENLTYGIGGDYDIGFTLNVEKGGVIGWEMGDRSYVIKDAVHISPPEALISLNNNNIMMGISKIGLALAIIGVWAPLFIAFLNLIKYLGSNKKVTN